MSTFESRKKTDRVLRWLRSCAVCSSWRPPVDFLCDNCWRELSRHRVSCFHEGYPFKVFALWEWTPKTEALVRPLIHGFKRGWAAQAALDFAETLCASRDLGDERICFVHPPSSDSPYDHAKLLADALATCFPGSHSLVLDRQKGDQSRQKSKKAAERSLFRFQRVEKFSAEGRLIVFVDDLVTTGSTAQAAYMALGLPLSDSERSAGRFEVWALAVRPKVAGMTGFW